MENESKQASPEMIQKMKNIQAQAEAAKRWMSQKKMEKNQVAEQAGKEEEMAAIEKEINNL